MDPGESQRRRFEAVYLAHYPAVLSYIRRRTDTGFARGNWGPPAYPLVGRVRREYDPTAHGVRSVEPYATFLIGYQYPA